MFGGELSGLSEAVLEDVFSEVPSSELPKSDLSGDRLLIDVLDQCEVVKSKGEARRLIKNGGLYLNNVRIEAEDARLTEESLCTGSIAVIRTGKKNYHLLKFS